MKFIKKLLKNTDGFTLIELVIAITVFIIGVVPIYKMIVSGAKVQNVAEETYEATQLSQALLQDVKNQIEKDVDEEYKIKRGTLGTIKPWLDPSKDMSTINSLFVNFLEIKPENPTEGFDKKYNVEKYLYEVHIWPMVAGEPDAKAISFISDSILKSEFNEAIPFEFIKDDNTKKIYFENNDSLIWAGLGGTTPRAIGEVTYTNPETIKVRENGIKMNRDGAHIEIVPITGYATLGDNIKLKYAFHEKSGDETFVTHELIIEDINPSVVEEIVQLAIDLTTFPSDPSSTISRLIRIENKTKATVIIPVYNENLEKHIKIYPIQQNKGGKIIVEERPKLEPSKNFIINIIVRDANNIAFGDTNKVLSNIVDVYSFDYNKQ